MQTLQVEMVLGGYQIPSGTKVVSAGMVISNDGDHFDEPDEFIPERWLRGNPLYNTADPFSFLPFGRGPRYFWGTCSSKPIKRESSPVPG